MLYKLLVGSSTATLVSARHEGLILLQMLVDDIGDVTITNDGATILKLLEVQHPAAKVLKPSKSAAVLCARTLRCKRLNSADSLPAQILVELADMQDQEVGDGTTSVVIFAAELLQRAHELVRHKIHPTSIISGYRLAMREVSCPAAMIADLQFAAETVRRGLHAGMQIH